MTIEEFIKSNKKMEKPKFKPKPSTKGIVRPINLKENTIETGRLFVKGLAIIVYIMILIIIISEICQ